MLVNIQNNIFLFPIYRFTSNEENTEGNGILIEIIYISFFLI